MTEQQSTEITFPKMATQVYKYWRLIINIVVNMEGEWQFDGSLITTQKRNIEKFTIESQAKIIFVIKMI